MGLLSKIFGGKKDTQQVNIYETLNGYGTWYRSTVKSKADSDTVQAAIHAIARHASKMKFEHVKKGERPSTIDNLLNGYPNPYMPAQQFIYRAVALLFTYDNVYIYPQKNAVTDETEAYWIFHPTKSQLVSPKGRDELWVELTFLREKKILPYESIIHLRNYFVDDDIQAGLKSESSVESIKNYDLARKSIINATRLSSRLLATIKVNDALSPTDKAKIIEDFNKYITGVNDDGTENSVYPQDITGELIPMNLSPKMAASNQLTSLKTDILEHIGVPESVIKGDYTEKTFNAFYESILEPLQMQLTQVFTQRGLTEGQRAKGEKIEAKMDLIQYASWSTKVAIVKLLAPIQGMTIGKIREMFGGDYDKERDGDKYLQSLNYAKGDGVDKYQEITEEGEPKNDETDN